MNIPIWQVLWKLHIGFASTYFDFSKKPVQVQRLQAVTFKLQSAEALVPWAKDHAQGVVGKANVLIDTHGPPFSSTIEEMGTALQILAENNVFVQTEEIIL